MIVGTQAGIDMELTVCNSGLKVTTKEQGLTEYRAHRITYTIWPEAYPKLFVWVYKHEGKKLKVGSHSHFNVRLHVMQRTVLLSQFCPFVRRVYCDKTKQRTANILIPHEMAITLVF